jgi:hypothetical protein
MFMVSMISTPRSSAGDLDRLRDVVGASRLAIGLIAFPSRVFLELSGPALELTGLQAGEDPVDLSEQTFAIVLMDLADDPNRIAELLIGLEASLSTTEPGPIIGQLHGDDGAPQPVDSGERLAELETRFRRIAHEIDAAGLFDPRSPDSTT